MHKDIINDILVINPARKKNGESSCEQLQSRMYFLSSHIWEVEVKDRKKIQIGLSISRECVGGNTEMKGPEF